ncbi:MAG: hypothetical protein WC726_04495 [Parcubacteria group bacterium]|jgi:hypothetical protein
MEPNKKIENATVQTAKPVQAQGGNKTLFWILGGCLVLLVIGGLVVAGVAYWSYKKIKNESKMKDAAIVQQQKQLEAAKIEAQKKPKNIPENVPTNIPEEPIAVEQPVSGTPVAAEGTTQYVAEKQIGFVKKVYAKSGKNYINIDYIQWLTGDTAEKALREDGQCPKSGECIVYDDYYIRNQNPLIRTFELSPDAKIVMQTYSAEQTGIVMNNEEITFDQFKNIFSSAAWSHLKDVPYIVEISNQQIVKITEQYIP